MLKISSLAAIIFACSTISAAEPAVRIKTVVNAFDPASIEMARAEYHALLSNVQPGDSETRVRILLSEFWVLGLPLEEEKILEADQIFTDQIIPELGNLSPELRYEAVTRYAECVLSRGILLKDEERVDLVLQHLEALATEVKEKESPRYTHIIHQIARIKLHRGDRESAFMMLYASMNATLNARTLGDWLELEAPDGTRYCEELNMLHSAASTLGGIIGNQHIYGPFSDEEKRIISEIRDDERWIHNFPYLRNQLARYAGEPVEIYPDSYAF